MPAKPKEPDRRAAPKPRTKPRVKPDPQPDAQPEARINLKGDDNAVAVGPKSFAANIKVVFQGNWKPFAAVLFGVGVLLAAILYFVVPKLPGHFGGEFNVAVAKFIVQDENGKAIRGKQGFDLAQSIAGQLEANFNEMRLNTVATYEIWGPDRTRVIESENEAREFALSRDATIVIYGRVKVSNGISFFSPQFYVNQAAFKDAEEITGQHELGKDVQGKLDADLILAESPGVQARVDGLSMLTIGLVYYSVDQYDKALVYFQKADNPDWVGSGKETVYLLIGNTYIRKASKTKDFSALPDAEKSYQDALGIDPNYGRAMIGEANVLYLRAYVQDNCDRAGLEAASALLDDALSLTDQPASANIETKVHFYRGQIALMRYDCQLPDGNWASIAENEFAWVTARYEADPESEASQSIQSFASHAYARLSYLAYYDHNDIVSAITYIQKAIPIAPMIYQADYLSQLGDMYVVAGEKDNAIESYQKAIAIARSYDAQSVPKYQRKLDSVSGP